MYLLLVLLLAMLQPSPQTNLAITGDEQAGFTASDANACALDEDSGALRGQLTDPSSQLIISFTIKGTVGDHPAANQLTAVSLDGPEDNPIVNWSAAGGTVTLDDTAAAVAIESGDPSVSAGTQGVRGHLDADLSSALGAFHVSGPFACHTAR
jgi:hypothetical protein